MKKILYLFVGAAVLFAGCAAKPEVPPDDPVSVESVSVSPPTLELDVNDEYTLSATATDKRVEWSSTDESVATVDPNGKVTALKVGDTTITATM